MNKKSKVKITKWLILIAIVIFLAGAGFIVRGKFFKTQSQSKAVTYEVTRGELLITVTESGEVGAVKTKEIKSKVEGRTAIVSVVDEGIFITDEDVKNGKILVELDSSDIEQKLTQQEVTFLTAESDYAVAKEALDIQKDENESKIRKGNMSIRFKRMDLCKYLGQKLGEKSIAATDSDTFDPNTIAEMIKDTNLGGQALQRVRELNNNLMLSNQELKQAQTNLGWTKKLLEKKYISRNEFEADQLKTDRLTVSCDKSKTEIELFNKYEFLKETQQLLNDYKEAVCELGRIKALAGSKEAQAQSKMASKEARFLLQKDRLKKLKEQLEACTIKATTPGQVIYKARRNEVIEVGTEVRERQKILEIPDISSMKIQIKIHENWIDKIELAQKADIEIIAFPDKALTGAVTKKSPLADKTHWWRNPDLKVYCTDVVIDGTNGFLKCGMTAKVTVLLEKKDDVLKVPLQAVINHEGDKVCFVDDGFGAEPVVVETGLFNDDFVEIISGLKEGQKILLSPDNMVNKE